MITGQGEQDPIQPIAASQGHCWHPAAPRTAKAPMPLPDTGVGTLLPECPPLPQPSSGEGRPGEAPCSSQQHRTGTGLRKYLPEKFNTQPQAEPRADGASPETSRCLAELAPKEVPHAATVPQPLLFLCLYPLNPGSFQQRAIFAFEGGNQLVARSGATWRQNRVVFPAALQRGLGQGAPAKGLSSGVTWQEAEHFQPPAPALLAGGVFAVPSSLRGWPWLAALPCRGAAGLCGRAWWAPVSPQGGLAGMDLLAGWHF